MLQDLLRAMEGPEEAIDELAPYFLGSVVLIKGDEADSQVIDGQQRLTTLTMLLSALRSLIKSDYAKDLTAFLCEKGNIVTGTPTRYRLTLRKQDAEFFKTYIQDENGIEELKQLQGITSESQRNIRDNTLSFINQLRKLSEQQLIKLTQFVVNRCFMIVVAVSTTDLDSAYRIFSVLNNRGLNLSYPDILKTKYKEQGGVERRFRFLKDPLFFASSVFVKKPERVVALSFIMVLSLLVYRLAEHLLRSRLAETEETIPNQVNKPTQRPTMRWIFQCFEGIDLLYIRIGSYWHTQVFGLQALHQKKLSKDA